jgi:hypothetical protein
MKKRYAGLAVVVLSLVAFGVGNAQIAFYGVVNPNTYNVQVATAIVYVSPTVDTVTTTGWGGTSQDTFKGFPNYSAWPDSIQLTSTITGMPSVSMFASPVANTWYDFTFGGIVKPKALFYSGAANVEEPRSATGPTQRLQVSPSVVTEQMAVRLQPIGTGRPVVEIHDAIGNVIRSLDCTAGANGTAVATWNREDEFGRLVPEGVYFCRYAASGVVAVRKVLVTH